MERRPETGGWRREVRAVAAHWSRGPERLCAANLLDDHLSTGHGLVGIDHTIPVAIERIEQRVAQRFSDFVLRVMASLAIVGRFFRNHVARLIRDGPPTGPTAAAVHRLFGILLLLDLRSSRRGGRFG